MIQDNHLPAHIIEIWPFGLAESPDRTKTLLASLAADEQNRINEGIFPEIGRRHAISRVGLRRVLSSYLDVAPQEISLIKGEHGKPFLATGDLAFNLSHTGDHALVAVSRHGDLGVDLEKIRESAPIEDLALRCFSPEELEQWQRCPSELRVTSFFHLWAQKEAFLKAHGGGMTIPLKDFDCSVDPAVGSGTIRSRIDGDATKSWRFIASDLGQDLRFAIVWDGEEKVIFERNPEDAGLSRW